MWSYNSDTKKVTNKKQLENWGNQYGQYEWNILGEGDEGFIKADFEDELWTHQSDVLLASGPLASVSIKNSIGIADADTLKWTIPSDANTGYIEVERSSKKFFSTFLKMIHLPFSKTLLKVSLKHYTIILQNVKKFYT